MHVPPLPLTAPPPLRREPPADQPWGQPPRHAGREEKKGGGLGDGPPAAHAAPRSPWQRRTRHDDGGPAGAALPSVPRQVG